MKNGADHCGGGRPLERSPPGCHLVDDRAQREDVAARISFAGRKLFGRHVGIGAEHCSCGGNRPIDLERSWTEPAGPDWAEASTIRSRAASAPAFVSITLPGFRSRCTSPQRCA